jgi:hypothetical protein
MRNYDRIRRAKWGYGGDAGSAGTLLCGEHSRNEDVEEGAPSASLPERLAAADPAKLRVFCIVTTTLTLAAGTPTPHTSYLSITVRYGI